MISCTKGRVAQVRYSLSNVTVDSHVTIVRPLKEIFYPDFFGWALILIEDEIATKGEGCGGQTELSRSTLRDDFNISYPKSLPEQQRIIAILDEAFAALDKAKANAEQNLKNAKELFESYLQGVFEKKGEGWEEKTLAKIAKHSLGKMLDKNKNRGIPQKYLRNQSVRWFEFDLSYLNEMLFFEDEKEKYTAVKGDVLICEGGYPGRAAIWYEDYPIFFQKALHRVRFNNKEYNKWFLYYLYILDKTDKLKEHFTGTGIQHFTGQSHSKLVISLPPLDQVLPLVHKLEELSAETKKLEAIYQQKLDDLEELKKTILQKAFAGELGSPEGVGYTNDGHRPSEKKPTPINSPEGV